MSLYVRSCRSLALSALSLAVLAACGGAQNETDPLATTAASDAVQPAEQPASLDQDPSVTIDHYTEPDAASVVAVTLALP